jgi:predicted unusual protein kinase regulating ubiquinone biosynthesis (AarF/ABC1/UbiB family)
MAANARLPQYDPEIIKKSDALRSNIVPPSEIQSRVAKSFYQRLKKLEKFDAQYGDVHANNLMQRENGDLVIADVGLFLFGKKGARGYAGAIVERLQHLAGII